MTHVFVECDVHGTVPAYYDRAHSGMAYCPECGAMSWPIFKNDEDSIIIEQDEVALVEQSFMDPV